MPCGVYRPAAPAIFAGMLLVLVPMIANDTPGRIKEHAHFTAMLHTTDRIIIRLHDQQDDEAALPGLPRTRPMTTARSRSLGMVGGTTLTPIRRSGNGAHIVRLTHAMDLAVVEAIVKRLKQDPAVAHAEPDRRRIPMTVPTDPGYRPASGALGQWNLRDGPGGINMEPAWSITQGSASTVIAIIDTGMLADIEFTGRTFPGVGAAPFYGYDFVSEDNPGQFSTANDGDGRDADARDPGNWIDATEAGVPPFTDCAEARPSNWHGTHTAGVIAANANNGAGITGIDWHAKLVPVRVLGKCGGYVSDIIDGLLWAAGLAVPGVPINAHPANIINMSLGGIGACSPEEQRAINQALAQPQLKAIITAAGNDGLSSLNTAPGNCSNVITVAATDYYGSRAPYSSGGVNVVLSAPGGYFGDPPAGVAADELGILSLANPGATGPDPRPNELWYFTGSSQASAHVSGVVGLMLAHAPTLTPFQVYAILRNSALSFPDSSCSISICGSGILDATGAVIASATPPADRGLGFGGVAQVPASGTQRPSAAASSGGGGGGGGGCTIGNAERSDWLLALLVLAASAGVCLRRGPTRITCR